MLCFCKKPLQKWKRQLRRGLINVISTQKKGVKRRDQALPGDIRQQNKRKQVEIDAQEVLPENEEEPLYCVGDCTVEQITWSVEFHSLEISQNHLDVILCHVL